MKRINLFFFAVALVGFAVSCNKEVANTEPVNDDEFNVPHPTVICASIGEGDTKAFIDGSTGNFTWKTGDKIAVYAGGWKVSDALSSTYNGSTSASFSFTDNPVVDANRADFAVYPSDLVTRHAASNTYHSSVELDIAMPYEYNLAEVQDDAYPCPMIATNTPGEQLAFKQLCALVRITVKNVPAQATKLRVNFGTVKVAGGAVVELKSVNPGTTYATPSPYGGNTYFDINLGEPRTAAQNITINLPVPVASYSSISVTPYADSYAICTVNSPLKSDGSAWNATRAKGRKVTVALPAFSVAANKKVFISKGNLQATYDGTSWSWAFATNQWDYVGDAAANTTISGDGTIEGTGTVDLFGWVGSSGYSYSYPAYYGIIRENTSYPKYGQQYTDNLMYDWGTLAISNGGNTANIGWRTLTVGEWDYLTKTRTTTSGVLYAKAKVNGVNGVILLPDDWNTGYYSLNTPNTKNADYTTNEISAAYWIDKLEAHGAVFLPAAGWRSSVTVHIAGQSGTYWSSSPSDNHIEYAQNFSFSSENLHTANSYRSDGRSVRLVYPIE